MEEENVLQRLRDHLCVVPFDTDRKHFRMAIREIERLQKYSRLV